MISILSTRNGGAHGCYGVGDWTFMKCREHMSNASIIYVFHYHTNYKISSKKKF